MIIVLGKCDSIGRCLLDYVGIFKEIKPILEIVAIIVFSKAALLAKMKDVR